MKVVSFLVLVVILSYSNATYGFRPPTKERPSRAHGGGKAAPVAPVEQARPEAPVETIVPLATSPENAKSIVCRDDTNEMTAYVNLSSDTDSVLIQRKGEEDISFETKTDPELENGTKYRFEKDNQRLIVSTEDHISGTAVVMLTSDYEPFKLSCHFYQGKVSPQSKLEQPKAKEEKAQGPEVSKVVMGLVKEFQEKLEERAQLERQNIEQVATWALETLKAKLQAE